MGKRIGGLNKMSRECGRKKAQKEVCSRSLQYLPSILKRPPGGSKVRGQWSSVSLLKALEKALCRLRLRCFQRQSEKGFCQPHHGRRSLWGMGRCAGILRVNSFGKWGAFPFGRRFSERISRGIRVLSGGT